MDFITIESVSIEEKSVCCAHDEVSRASELVDEIRLTCGGCDGPSSSLEVAMSMMKGMVKDDQIQ